MAKRFKLRISRVITTTFQSCRSKDPSSLPQNPVPSFFRFTPLVDDFPAVNPPSRVTLTTHDDQRHRSSFRRNVSTASSAAFISRVGCGFSSTKHDSPDDGHPQHHNTRSSQQFKWRKEEKWHVVAKIYEKNQTPRPRNSDNNDDGGEILAVPPPPPPVVSLLERKKRRGNKKKISSSRFRMSTSSAESGLFSSEVGDERDEKCDDEEEEEEETETLVSSSRSFYSTDSSSLVETVREIPFTRRHSHRRRTKKKTYYNKKPSTKRSLNRPSSLVSEGGDSPARLSVFKKFIPCAVDGKVKDSFAIVKKSEDPYEDFKRSMMEMILEKQMFEEKDLEQLLQCFLSLNSRHYHGLIVEAFADIWQALFCSSSARNSTHHHRRVGFQ